MKLFADALPNLSRTREGNLAIVSMFEKAAERNRQELALLEKMIMDGSYTPSEYAQRVLSMGNVWTPAERKTLDNALMPPAPAAPAQAPAPAAPAGPIANMTREDILALDISKLTPAQRQAVANRMSALGM
jgi:hypothetical protein